MRISDWSSDVCSSDLSGFSRSCRDSAGGARIAARYAARRGICMLASIQGMKDMVARLVARPDEIMLSLGASGELLVARLRALLSLLILAMPLIAALGGVKSGEVVVGLGLAVFTNLMVQIWLVLARRQLRYRWLSYATSTYDVSLTTLALALPGPAVPAPAPSPERTLCGNERVGTCSTSVLTPS